MKRFVSSIKKIPVYKITIASGFGLYIMHLINKKQRIRELDKGFYKSNIEIDSSLKFSSTVLDYQMMKRSKFIQIIENDFDKREPNPVYYNLLQNIPESSLHLRFLPIKSIRDSFFKELVQNLDLKNESDLENVDYILKDPQGKNIPIFKGENNFVKSRRILNGIPTLRNLNEFVLKSMNNPETIFILKHPKDVYIEESYINLFPISEDIFSFFKISISGLRHSYILFNPKFYKVNNSTDLLLFDKFKQTFLAYDAEKIFNEIERFLIAQIIRDQREMNSLINSVLSFNTNNLRRKFYVNSPEFAHLLKHKIVTNKEKLIFIFLNEANLNKLRTDFSFVEKLVEIFEAQKLSYIITSNPKINYSFNVIANPNENLTIRFFDYDKIVYFNNKENFEIFQSGKLSTINKDKNKLFYFKGRPSIENVTEENMLQITNEFKHNNFKNIPPYLENDENNLKSFSSVVAERNLLLLNNTNFKKEILSSKGFSLVGITAENALGCATMLKFLQNSTKFPMDFNIYSYNILNENIDFQKFKNATFLIVFKDGKKIQEINFLEFLENFPGTYEEEVCKELSKVI